MPPRSGLSAEPDDRLKYTNDFDQFYTRFAGAYDLIVKTLPPWRNWLEKVLPFLNGPRILEISFGTGYLLTKYAGHFQVCGIDYNMAMVKTARNNLQERGLHASLQQADVCHLPFASGSYDSIVNTMAFSGYPDGHSAIAEMKRVLKPGGRLIMLDVYYPQDQNWLGMAIARFWKATGDILREMGPMFEAAGLAYTESEIGGFGSVHLYRAWKA